MKKRNLIAVVGAAVLTLASVFTVFAGTWQQDHVGWWYQEDDGSYPANTWQWIDGNKDGIAECYYFDQNGYLLTNAVTPDGYQVDSGGAWTVESMIQTQVVSFYAETSNLYTYKELECDVQKLHKRYPQTPIVVDSLVKTFDERELYHIVVGDPNADKHVLITGAIHAREYITAQLVMRQVLDVCDRYSEYMQTNSSVAFHFVPMVNPDGVTLSQLGLEAMNLDTTKQTLLQIAQNDSAEDLNSYFTQWKANIRGVDLNRNFDALWENYRDGAQMPSSLRYKGTAPHSEPESKALVDLTECVNFAVTISYHTQGEIIYWYFGQAGVFLEESRRLADLGKRCTGYKTVENYRSLDGAGYKDWAIQKKGIPGLTIEVGHGTNPVPHDQMMSIWEQNKNLISMILREYLV